MEGERCLPSKAAKAGVQAPPSPRLPWQQAAAMLETPFFDARPQA
jgi:hypothetical protein